MSSPTRQVGQLCEHEIHDEREHIYEEMVRRGGDMPRAELRLRLLSKVGEAKRVPTDQSWTSNRVGLATLRTAQRHAALHLQAYVRRLLQKRFTRGSGATSSSCQHILDHVQHLVQKGQAVIADIETITAQRAAGHLFTWQARRQAYGEGVIALSTRPHKLRPNNRCGIECWPRHESYRLHFDATSLEIVGAHHHPKKMQCADGLM